MPLTAVKVRREVINTGFSGGLSGTGRTGHGTDAA